MAFRTGERGALAGRGLPGRVSTGHQDSLERDAEDRARRARVSDLRLARLTLGGGACSARPTPRDAHSPGTRGLLGRGAGSGLRRGIGWKGEPQVRRGPGAEPSRGRGLPAGDPRVEPGGIPRGPGADRLSARSFCSWPSGFRTRRWCRCLCGSSTGSCGAAGATRRCG